ncbi:MAG: sodium:solute symporter family protein [Pseudomonadota bacterium]
MKDVAMQILSEVLGQLNEGIIVTLLFYAVCLIVGMHFHGRIKDFKDFAIGGKPMHTTIVTATATATIIGAEMTFGFSEQIYNVGIVASIMFIGKLIRIFLFAYIIGPLMPKLKNMYTMGDIWQEHYGKQGKLFSGLMSAMNGCFCVAMQIAVFGYMAKSFFGINETIGAIFSIIIVAFYCYRGGVKAVIMTDVIQVLVIIVVFPLLCYFAVVNYGGIGKLTTNIMATEVLNVSNHPKLYNYLLLFVISTIPHFDPAEFHRLIIARTSYRINKSMVGAGIVSIGLFLIITVLTFISYLSNPDLSGGEVLIYAITNYTPNGVAIAGYLAIIAVVMSTIDSYLNSTSIITVHDVIEPIYGCYIFKEEKTKAAQRVTVVVAIIAGFLALTSDSIMELVFNSIGIWHPTVVIPMLACLFKIKASFEVVKKSAISAIVVFVIWKCFGLENLTGIVAVAPCMLVNLIAFVTFRHIEMNAPVASKDNELVAGVKAIRQKVIKVRSASMGQENSMDINYHLTQIEQKAEAVMAKINNHLAKDEQDNQGKANTQARPRRTNKDNTETIAVDGDGHPTYQTTIQHVNKLSSQITVLEHRARSILNKINRELAEEEDRKKAKDKIDS